MTRSTSGFKLRFVMTAAAVIILPVLALPALALTAESAMQRGDLVIATDSVREDVVVAGGDLTVNGVVSGSVFVVDGDCMIDHNGRVKGNITVVQGDVWIAAGASVDGEISVLSGKAKLSPQARVSENVRAMENVPSLTGEKIALIRRYIIFHRKVPKTDRLPEALDRIDLKSERIRKRHERAPDKIELYELGPVSPPQGAWSESAEAVFRGHDIRVRVCLFRFSEKQTPAEFWMSLRKQYDAKVSQSVHNSLGEGAHWFFRHEGASYVLWHKDLVLVSIVVRHDDDDPEADEWERVERVRDLIIKQLTEKSAAPPRGAAVRE